MQRRKYSIYNKGYKGLPALVFTGNKILSERKYLLFGCLVGGGKYLVVFV